MSNRISSAGFHNAAIEQMLAKQTLLSRTQAQVASGKRNQTPADDPIAAASIADLQRTTASLEQYDRNSVTLRNRLGMTEQSLADVINLLQRARELAVQGNSAALDSVARSSLTTEIRARAQELLAISNRRDASGEYLFAGYSVTGLPFSRGASTVAYAGDQGTRQLQIAPDQRVADGFSGHDVFMNIPEDNGVFATSEGVHTGAGSIDNGRVINAAAWVSDSYTLQFTTATSWEVRNSANALVSSGAYVAESAIGFNGAQVVVSGNPAAGDTFTIAPSGKESLFDTLDELAAALQMAGDSPGGRSSLNTGINAALAQIDQGLSRLVNQRADVGARLNTVESADASRDSLMLEMKTSLSQLQDLDYAEAISRMNQQLTGLQAAQAAYTRIAQLSLFNYL